MQLLNNMRNICNLILIYLIYLYAFIFPISLALSNTILSFMLLCWLMGSNLKEKIQNIIKNKLVIIVYLIPLMIFISTIFSSSISNGFLISSNYKNEYEFIFKHFIWLNFLFIILLTTKIEIKKIITFFLFGMFFSEIVSYLVFFKLIDIYPLIKKGLLYRNIHYYDPSPFMHHTFYSIFLAVSIILIFDNIHNFKNKILKTISIIFLISATINLFLNGGRLGQIAFFIGIIIYVFLKYKKIKYILFSLVILISVFFLAFNFSPIFKQRVNLALYDIKKVHSNYYATSWGARVGLNKISIKILTKNLYNFILGLKAGDAKKIYFDYAKNSYPQIYRAIHYMKIKHVHNQFFQLWIDGGIFALLLIILYFIYLYKYSPYPVTGAIISVFVFSFLGDVILYRPKTYILFLFISAILYKLKVVYEKKSNIL